MSGKKRGRHKCPICAYNKGKAVAKGKKFSGVADMCPHAKVAPKDMLGGLPDNQGGVGRHKYVYHAYDAGIEAG